MYSSDEISTDGKEIRVDLEEKSEKVFSIRIPNSYDSKMDLLVRVAPIDEKSDPDMFISKTNKKPLTFSESDWGSSVVGEDIVSVNY